jgi:hypothetical protein
MRIETILPGFVKHFLCVVFIVKHLPNTTANITPLTQHSEEFANKEFNRIVARLILQVLMFWMDYKEFQQLRFLRSEI